MGITKGDLIRVGFKKREAGILEYQLSEHLSLTLRNKIFYLISGPEELALTSASASQLRALIYFLRTCKE